MRRPPRGESPSAWMSGRSNRIPVGRERAGPHLGAAARSDGRHVAAVPDHRRDAEVLVQVVDELDHPTRQWCRRQRRSRTSTGAAPASHRPTPPACGQTRTPNLAASSRIAMFSLTPATRVASICRTSQRAGLQELLEHDPVGHVLAGRDRHRARSPRAIAAWPRMSSGLVGSSIQARSNWREARHPVDRLVDVPALVGVDGDRDVGTDRLAGDAPAGVRRRSTSAPTLSLIWANPSRDRLPAQPRELVVVVAEPAGRGGVGRIALARAAAPRARARPGSACAQDLQRLVAGEGVGEVAEVDQVDDLLGRHPASSCHSGRPARLAFRSQSALTTAPMAMCMTPFSGPSQRSWESWTSSRHRPPRSREHVLDVPTNQVRREALDRGDLHVVAAADGEHEAVPVQPVVGVGARSERRRPSSRDRGSWRPSRRGQRRREPHIVRAKGLDAAHGALLVIVGIREDQDRSTV